MKYNHSKIESHILYLGIFFLLCFPLSIHAGNFNSSARGTTSANFLKLGPGARAAALSEAYSALANEPTALYWNPAALRLINSKSATFMHAAYLDSSFFDYAAFALPINGNVTLGLGLQFFSAGSITQRDAFGLETGEFTPSNTAISFGYARKFYGLSWGVSGKWIRSKILETAQTFALDAGLLSPLYFDERLRLALTATNLGGKIKFEEKSEHLPTAFRVGSAYKLMDHWMTSFDVSFPRDNDPILAAGTEYEIPLGSTMKLATRGGFNSRTVGDVDGLTGISLGLGFGFERLSLDYAFQPMGDLGLAHRVSLTFSFNSNRNPK